MKRLAGQKETTITKNYEKIFRSKRLTSRVRDDPPIVGVEHLGVTPVMLDMALGPFFLLK